MTMAVPVARRLAAPTTTSTILRPSSTFRAVVTAMKAVDPTITSMGPDPSWKYQSGANDWLTPFLTECGEVLS